MFSEQFVRNLCFILNTEVGGATFIIERGTLLSGTDKLTVVVRSLDGERIGAMVYNRLSPTIAQVIKDVRSLIEEDRQCHRPM